MSDSLSFVSEITVSVVTYQDRMCSGRTTSEIRAQAAFEPVRINLQDNPHPASLTELIDLLARSNGYVKADAGA